MSSMLSMCGEQVRVEEHQSTMPRPPTSLPCFPVGERRCPHAFNHTCPLPFASHVVHWYPLLPPKGTRHPNDPIHEIPSGITPARAARRVGPERRGRSGAQAREQRAPLNRAVPNPASRPEDQQPPRPSHTPGTPHPARDPARPSKLTVARSSSSASAAAPGASTRST